MSPQNILIVHAHPEPKSFSASMKNEAAAQLQRAGHSVQVSDLYAMGFDPVASAEDLLSPANRDYCVYALEQRHATANGTFTADIRQELEKLRWCDLLILNFPVFWCSTPAMLKGWIDRVLASGVVYGGKRFYDRGGMQGKRVLVSVTIGGQEHMFSPDGVHGPLKDMLKHLLQGTLGYAGFSVLEPFVAWHIPYLSEDQRKSVMEAWTMRLSTLAEEQQDIPMPSLSDFDDKLQRLPPA